MTFHCRDTEALFAGHSPRRFRAFERSAQRKLHMLDTARDLQRDLGGLPGNRLEKLAGDREGQWSIRINDQWRVCFAWRKGDAYDVEIVDYH
ncbi:MAG: excinuclease ABC subunit A [Candidatus Muproteobacteria bacterium RIFCSPHIGHO2_02_FULL_65_16]|uniref:Excinuclease ABC subunit A n=1 Tax=Candidatus Muproteobacteria bacterium RIFCSPHIGHO2_02_FULL_65_16 TaxID=1817766 RepID=A0A1F6U2Y9_9PROT|nr:MAG: excinuclease ABC subunit A [Candidatus Muproteobacteria bacterium RIFCSPHIGHO2_02_FULL_65_16]